MNKPLIFPNDENGDGLRHMQNSGDNLAQPRTMDFSFAFPKRQQAIAFAAVVDNRELKVCISYYGKQEMWQVVVQRHMVPSHREITSLESSLTKQAVSVGGEADGWGCMPADAAALK